MAKAKSQPTQTRRPKKRIRRPGVHAKTRHSNSKQSKHYQKQSVGQG
jgi:hypothetical protein